MHSAARPSSTRLLGIAAIGCLIFAAALFQLSGRATPTEPTLLETMRPGAAR